MEQAADFTWVLPDLAIGGAIAAGRAASLALAHGVGAVIDVRAEACDCREELAACGLDFLHLPTEDLCGVSQPMLDRGVAFGRRMGAAGRRLLVHCQHGIGRSATVALCIMVDRGIDPLAAITTAKDARALVSPSAAQFQAWTAWVRRRAPWAAIPSYHAFGCVAYRHLTRQA